MRCDNVGELFKLVMEAVMDVVKVNGGSVCVDLVRPDEPGFLFAVSVDGTEWTRAVWNDDDTVGLHNSVAFVDRITALAALQKEANDA